MSEHVGGVIVPGASVAREVIQERVRQDAVWGEQNHPNGTSGIYGKSARYYRDMCSKKHDAGYGTWLDILLEEVYEAAAEVDPASLRDELIQVAAVAVAWVECLDRTKHE